jgi:acyl transferase domain-containing protein
VNKIQNMMAARISDYYNLRGTSLVIDTACSSALVALHTACKSIMNGECDAAITGGIEILVDPYEHIGFSKSGALSDGPYSFVFDERANGFVLGEGAGLIMLKDFEKAVEDGDQILGIILGSAVNNDGHTMGLTVPNQDGQKEVIRQAVDASGINPETISLYEAHGTGTLLGDPIEIKAATTIVRQYTDEKQFCAVGSVKSNIGHLLRAAGIAGVIKLLLAIQYKQIPPTLNCERPHPRFRFEDSPFYPIREMKEWKPRKGVRRAAISAFGFGGTNAHVILEGFDPGTVDFYQQKRKPLPVTEFMRKRYWLGEEITVVDHAGHDVDEDEAEYTAPLVEEDDPGYTWSEMEDDAHLHYNKECPSDGEDSEVTGEETEDTVMDDETYRELLVKLQNGEITPEELMEMEGGEMNG